MRSMITSESANLWIAICVLGYVLLIVEWRWKRGK